MGMPVRIDDALSNQARATARALRRTIAGQIEFWAVVRRTALDNQNLPIDIIRDLLVARGEGQTLATLLCLKASGADGNGRSGTAKRHVQPPPKTKS